MSLGRKVVLGALGALSAGGIGLAFSLENSVKASDLTLHPPKLEWPHNGYFDALDHAAIRRGYEVYKNVCSACHSLRFVCYRNLVDVSHTYEEAKAEAAEVMVTDGPDENGEMFQRPGKLSDPFQNPYANEEKARLANDGALPPDLSLITLARHGNEDYLFALLTGYCEPPAGVKLREGLYYNPYFPGGAIGMAQALYNETIEYNDGTPATASQMAKDVTVFLKWCAEPEHDDRKKMGIKAVSFLVILNAIVFYYYRHTWTVIRNQKFQFLPIKK